jgi:hypothetical protein
MQHASRTVDDSSVSTTVVAIPAPWRTNWIISKRDDLTWFIGSAVVSYAAFGLMATGFPIMLIYLIWLIGVDGPHVIATVTRTYFDKQERQRLGWFLWIIVPLTVAGPVMVWLGFASLFYLFAVSWQHYHIIKQHYGFIMLWKAKNKDRDAFDMKLDRLFLLASTILPLGLFVVKTRLAGITWVEWTASAVVAMYLAFVGVYLIHQVKKLRAGLPMNTPKLLLLGVLVPLQWLIFMHSATLGPDGIMRAGITLGLFHSFQYHRLLWFHNRNRYAVPEGREKYGLAAFFAKDFGIYIFTAIGLHILLSVLPQTMNPGVAWITAAIWGIPFTHYMLDSKIWKVRGNKELAAALRL